MIKNNLYNFALPERVELVPRNWAFKTLGEPKFSVVLVTCGRLQRFSNITNKELSQMPITGLIVTKCPKGTVIKKFDEEG